MAAKIAMAEDDEKQRRELRRMRMAFTVPFRFCPCDARIEGCVSVPTYQGAERV